VRLVLDTNTALSGLLWGGTPGRLFDAADTGLITLASSTPLLTELQGVLLRVKFANQLARRGLRSSDVFDGYAAIVVLVTPAAIAPMIMQDPSDDQVLACALAAKADLIVSGDKHLLNLGGQYNGILIVTAAEAVRLINEPLPQSAQP
jgi:putative PIN family toxin of toxin-antitoxin system